MQLVYTTYENNPVDNVAFTLINNGKQKSLDTLLGRPYVHVLNA